MQWRQIRLAQFIFGYAFAIDTVVAANAPFDDVIIIVVQTMIIAGYGLVGLVPECPATIIDQTCPDCR